MYVVRIIHNVHARVIEAENSIFLTITNLVGEKLFHVMYITLLVGEKLCHVMLHSW